MKRLIALSLSSLTITSCNEWLEGKQQKFLITVMFIDYNTKNTSVFEGTKEGCNEKAKELKYSTYETYGNIYVKCTPFSELE